MRGITARGSNVTCVCRPWLIGRRWACDGDRQAGFRVRELNPPGMERDRARSLVARLRSGSKAAAAVSFLHRFGSRLNHHVPSYFQSLEHLLRYCARPPFALERLSVTRGPDGRITRFRYVLPRHKAANWVGPARAALSNSHQLSFSTGSRISCRRRGGSGIGITASFRPITSSGGPSRRWQSGMSASNARRRPLGMGATGAPQEATATRLTRPKMVAVSGQVDVRPAQTSARSPPTPCNSERIRGLAAPR